LSRKTIAGAAIVAVTLVVLAAPAAASPAEHGYELTVDDSPAPGLVRQTWTRAGEIPQVVNVARIRPDHGLAVRAVLSRERIAGGGSRLERTSAMCRRVECLVAVNADFAMPGEDTPVGGMIAAGEMVRSFSPQHHQISVRGDGSLSTEPVGWRGQVMPTDLEGADLTGVNVPRREHDLILYTPRYGPSTGTNPHGVELVLEPVEPGVALRLDSTVAMRVTAIRQGAGDTSLSEGRVVISGHGTAAAALASLAARIAAGDAGDTVLLRLETDGEVVQSVGGTPVLVRDGRRYVGGDGPAFVSKRHPRTMAGWTADGEMLLVTVDGRQPGRAAGMTLAEAADLMVALGAVEALNLDGGGSSTFVAGGQVANRPSDRLVRGDGGASVVPVPGAGQQVVGYLERPVVSALVVVPEAAATLVASPPPSAEMLGPPTSAAEMARRTDPGSNPLDALPDLVVRLDDPGRLPAAPALVAVVALMFAAGGLGAMTRHRYAA
jgi:hypothetical protein